VLLPWGIDETFGVTADVPNDPLAQLNYALDGTGSRRNRGILFVKCQQDPICWSDYLDAVDAALVIFEDLDLVAAATSLRTLTYEAATRDTRKIYSNATVEEHVAAVKAFIEQRPAMVRAEVERLRQNQPVAPDGYTYCAPEGERCSFSGAATIAYGASGVFTYVDGTDGIDCGNAAFGGDPVPNVFKACYILQP
jgi:hypothetical protein